jgi:hypothetical protein
MVFVIGKFSVVVAGVLQIGVPGPLSLRERARVRGNT